MTPMYLYTIADQHINIKSHNCKAYGQDTQCISRTVHWALETNIHQITGHNAVKLVYRT